MQTEKHYWVKKKDESGMAEWEIAYLDNQNKWWVWSCPGWIDEVEFAEGYIAFEKPIEKPRA